MRKNVVFLLAAALACAKAEKAENKEPPSAPQSPGWYRAVLGERQGTPIPFFLHVPPSGDEAFVATGPDRIRAKLESRPPKLALAFDILLTRIEATAGPSGVLEGTFESASGSWGKASLSFRAEPIAGPDPALRFPSVPGGPDPAGEWRIAFPDQVGKLTVARGAAGELLGTVAFPTGNLAFLAGSQDGRTIRLSAFDGGSPYLLIAEFDESGARLAGTWTAGQALAWKEAISGERAPGFVVEHQTKLVGNRPRLEIPQLAEAPYAGNPVIVELGGSWCPACGHAAGALRALRDEHAADGLQVLMLSYEFTDDPAYNRRQAETFKTKYDIPWEVVPVDGGLDKYNEILPPELEAIDASGFPIAIFVARDRGIEGFHSGFPPETWGTPHRAAVAEYARLAAKIVATAKEKR